MNRYLKYGLAAVAGVALLFVLLLVTVSLVINPNDYKPQIIQMVKDKKQRTLTLAGDIKLAFFPRLGFDLGRASVSEFQSDKEFAAVDSARLYLSWWPLLKKELVVDQVRVEGLRANLVRFKDGTTNFDDLLKKDEEDKQLKFDIDSVKIGKSALTFKDEMGGRQFALSRIELRTGRLANARPTQVELGFGLQGDKPGIKADVKLATELSFDTDAKRFSLRGMNLEILGEAAGLSGLAAGIKGDLAFDQNSGALLAENLAVAVAGKKGADDVDVRLLAPKVQWTADKLATDKIDLVATVKRPKGEMGLVANLPALAGDGESFRAGVLNVDLSLSQADGEYKGKLSSPLSGDLKSKRFVLSDIKANLAASDGKMPRGGMKLEIAGSAELDVEHQDVALKLVSRLDESTIKANLGASPFANPHLRIDVDVDQIDVDRYLPPKAKEENTPEKPLDFSALKTLNASGSVKIGSLKLYNVKASNVRLEFRAGDGRLEVSPLAASLYQGAASGSLSLNAAGPAVAVRQNITGVSIGPLLKDALDKDVLEGRGSVNIDVSAQGNAVSAMKKSLQGKAALNLRDGAVKGINIAATLREAKSRLGVLKGESVQAASAKEQTDFTELAASFNIQRGVAHNEDLAAKSPLLRLAGNGDIDIGAERLNYLAKATVVGTLKGQGGRELEALKGVTVPVRISGPFATPKFALDFNALVTESVKQEVKGRAQEVLKEGLKGLFR
ncbi:MAG: AsmA family protein [Sulfurimicrobium sp.]|nr:AsmA family protein [Sulfurimicrobium sp.]MDP1703900.1 AsmA family protein [Sulfurimicrobium sp.]MDP2197124.1 AsmA family protein [Sulfurimicrobium sp.]MDP3687140.1 AsmA family protein [Sulfurimicrobium sp.]MDZ7655845.1 AsmA family protein [Sulfurimicrobium sp.]